MLTLDIISERTVNNWYQLGWEVDDTGWHAPSNWDLSWGDPNHDFWLSDAEFDQIKTLSVIA